MSVSELENKELRAIQLAVRIERMLRGRKGDELIHKQADELLELLLPKETGIKSTTK